MPPLVQSLSLYVPMNARSLLFSLASLPSLASLSVSKRPACTRNRRRDSWSKGEMVISPAESPTSWPSSVSEPLLLSRLRCRRERFLASFKGMRAWAFTAFDSADCRRRGEFAHEFAHVVHRSDDRSDDRRCDRNGDRSDDRSGNRRNDRSNDRSDDRSSERSDGNSFFQQPQVTPQNNNNLQMSTHRPPCRRPLKGP